MRFWKLKYIVVRFAAGIDVLFCEIGIQFNEIWNTRSEIWVF